MTRRERLERRAERLRAWADKREARGRSGFERARQMADAIPFGQPILVGHHSEKRDRAYRERIHGTFSRAAADYTKAGDMNSRAAGIEGALEQSIYSDDADAIEQLREKLAGLEADRDRIKMVNKLIRSKGFEAAAPELTPTERAELLKLDQLCPYHKPLTRGFPTYTLSNLGGTITRTRQRIEHLSGQPRAAAAAKREGATATARAGLIVIASMTTPSRPGKKPRPVWNVTGAIGEWRQFLIRIGGSWYRGAFSFWEDPTEEIERACASAETPIGEVAQEFEQAEVRAGEIAAVPFALTSPIGKAGGKQEGLF